ncbi:hypothetical protein EK21DRAFT_25529, partial [Setomelanomma holmii]
KRLFINGAWITWLPILSWALYTAVSVGCMNKQKMLMQGLYLASYAPSAGTEVRIGYFGICVQTRQLHNDWICSRFLKDKNLGLTQDLLTLIHDIKTLQRNALYCLPAGAAILLLFGFITFRLTRWRGYATPKRWAIWFLWVSAAVGLAAGLMPMMVAQAMHYVGAVYKSATLMEFNLMGMVLTWVAVAAHVGYVGAAVWWE